MEKRLLTAGTTLALLALAPLSAAAADLPARRPPMPPAIAAVPLFTWTGFYIGVNAGAAWDDSTLRATPNANTFNPPLTPAEVTLLTGTLSKNDTAFTGGGQIGYNFQFGSLVLGAEADIAFVNIDEKDLISAAIPSPFNGLTIPPGLRDETALRHQIDWFGTARGRIGFAADRLLIYGTGGLAFGEVKSSFVGTVNPASAIAPAVSDYRASNSDTRIGWTVGGGVEYAFTNNLTVKAEYLYVDLGDNSFTATAGGGAFALAPGSTITVRDETKFHVGRAGLNWKF